jgi:hypothetical protein
MSTIAQAVPDPGHREPHPDDRRRHHAGNHRPGIKVSLPGCPAQRAECKRGVDPGRAGIATPSQHSAQQQQQTRNDVIRRPAGARQLRPADRESSARQAQGRCQSVQPWTAVCCQHGNRPLMLSLNCPMDTTKGSTPGQRSAASGLDRAALRSGKWPLPGAAPRPSGRSRCIARSSSATRETRLR